MSHKKTSLAIELPDDLNPKYIFSLTATELLLQIATGKIDPVQLAKDTLSNRGQGKDGEWIGFDQAEKLWNEKPKKVSAKIKDTQIVRECFDQNNIDFYVQGDNIVIIEDSSYNPHFIFNLGFDLASNNKTSI